ncbi:hypothetical protein B0T22DRAFT_407656 [Podospora appendiculata]|uniref:FAD-binding PCMH-type domain-containing protein n=1 Tax=Podospora appendiculata TaxID=314037 RepID=A0AAE0XAM1_9PEZI|nr:hypothetical protein B0T22DRAFT_407656 [Podospora appendiculata]
MGISSICRVLLLAGAAAAQTIATDKGVVVAADETTVAPAADAVVANSQEPEALQLTDAVLANLTAHNLTEAPLFAFGEDLEKRDTTYVNLVSTASCKTFPGDKAWPAKPVWAVFDLLTGGALKETVPIGAVCYPGNKAYDAAKCADLLAHWNLSATHSADPTSIMTTYYSGDTCLPQNGNTSTCTLGGFPLYSLAVTTVAQIQLAVNFARNANIRLVVKNTGHDFLGKSTGAGALSIWTHKLKTLEFIKAARTPTYSGPAFKLGAAVQVFELYEAANKHNVTAVGGECDGVGVTGGYIAGGGHSPMSSVYGMGADQVLSIDVVLPNGRFVTADETHNTDLFWAIRGGGGATFGVVTSMTVKVHPKTKVAGATWTLLTGDANGVPDKVFWAAMFAYWRKFPDYADQGTYAYSQLFNLGAPGLYMWIMTPWMVPGMSLLAFKAMIAPLLAEWAALGLVLEPTYFETDNLYDAWSKHFPFEGVANADLRTGSRLFPRSVWDNATTLEGMMEAVKAVVEDGSALIQYNVKAAAPAGTPASAANTHWRDAAWYVIMGTAWTKDDAASMRAVNVKITHDWMARLRVYGPGGYLNEGDVMEPDFQDAFYGTNYDRLLKIKRQVDPTDVFWAPTAVGSDRWRVSNQTEWLTLQTGRLCKV